MNRHFAALIRLAVLSALIVTPVSAPGDAQALSTGSGGWYWPTGTENFGGMSAWWQFRGDRWHLAQDMSSPRGHAVYAIADGVVLESKYVGGYGPGGTQGGAVVILHKTATGTQFKALYGHVSNLKFSKGDRVSAGAVVGTVNGSSPNHLHFGIHPGSAYPSDNNPFRGHTYTSSNTYGWVDPVRYLRENPRVVPYVAPAVPVVASVKTTGTPAAFGVAGGVVYWQERSADSTEAWSYAIASAGPIAALESTPPAFETERYAVCASPPGIVVKDRQPVVDATPSHTTPKWRTAVTLTGSIVSAEGKPFQGAPVTLERRSGATWTIVDRTITSAAGSYSVRYTPTTTSYLRTRFVPPATFIAATSPIVKVSPHVRLSAPKPSVTTPQAGRSFRVSGTLTPRHAKTAIVIVHAERLVDGSWVRVVNKRTWLADDAAGSRYNTSLKCARGSWRVRAYVPADSKHAATYSACRSFTVK